jgi:hypothetical protein
MRTQPDSTNDLARALKRQVEIQGDLAKRAIREYNKSLLELKDPNDARRLKRQREVQDIVQNYLQLRKKLDELCADAKPCVR